MFHRIAATAFALVLLAIPAGAHETAKGPIRVEHPWSRPTPPNARAGVVYLGLSSQADDRLIGGSSPMADRVELHKHEMEGDIARMRPVDAIELKPGAMVMLQPGGLHIMMIGLKESLKAGTRFPLTLRFEKAGEVKIVVAVEASRPAGMDHKH
jgi:copper(I)-binding protein